MKRFCDFMNESVDKEVESFNPVSQKSSGLKFKLFVDSYGYYKFYNHEPLLYVQYKDSYIKVSISDNPKILSYNKTISSYDFESIKKFIIRNKDLLLKYAQEKIDDIKFYDSLKNINESLNEKAILKSSVSGVPFDIWIDNGGVCKKHTNL